MKIAHVNLAKGFRGGERQTELLIRNIAKSGEFEQMLVCHSDSPLRHELSGVKNLTFLGASHMFDGHLSLRGIDLIHAHEAKAAHWAYIEFRLRRTPYIITRRVPNPLKKNYFTRRVYRQSARVIAISGAICKNLTLYDPNLLIDIIASAWTDWDVDEQAVEKLRRKYAGSFIIGHVGALMDRHKGQRYLIAAARYFKDKIPEMRFLFLGSGPDESELKELANDLDNVEFLGFRKDVGEYLSIMDLFVFPSNYEGLGSILLDVMGFSVPIIASSVDGITDIVHDGRTGILIPPADANSIIMAVENLYKAPELRRELAENAYAQMVDYSPASMADRYLALYRDILTIRV